MTVNSTSFVAMQNMTSVQTDQIQNQKLQLAFEVVEQLGVTKGMLCAEKLQLESENRKLNNDITQLMSVQIAELHSAVDNNRARREVIVQKLRTIVQRFEEMSETYLKNCAGFTLNPQPFKALITAINQYKDEDSRKYPDYCKDQKESTPIQSVVPYQPLLEMCREDTFLLSLTKASVEALEALKNELVPIKASNLALIRRKETMNVNHDLHLKELHKNERELQLRVVLEKVRSVASSIKWEIHTVHYSQCKSCSVAPVCEGLKGTYHKHHQDGVNKKINKSKRLVNDLIATLEGFVEPKEIK